MPQLAEPSVEAGSGAESASSLSVFDSLSKGDAASQWVVDGVFTGWPEVPVTSVRLIAVSENATFRVDGPEGPVGVLRLSRPGYVADPAQIESELAWMQAIDAQTGVPVPGVVAPSGASNVVLIRDDRGSGWFSVMTGFMPGTVLEDVADPTPYYEQIGAYTAELHDHARAWCRPEGFTRFSWTPTDMVGSQSRWGDWRNANLSAAQRIVLERAEAAALHRVADAPRGPETWGIVHADLRPSNVLIDGDHLTVIDFDDCGECWYLWDFAAALSFIEHEPYAPQIAKNWMRGYTAHHPLDDDELEFACALSMLRRLQMLGWTTTHREDALPPAQWNAQVPGSVDVAKRYLTDEMWLLH